MHSKLLTERCDARHLSSKPQRNWPAKEWQLGLAFISWLYTHTESTWCFMLYHCISILEMLMLRAFTNRNKSYLLALSCRLISCFFFFSPSVILLFVVLSSRVFSIFMTGSHLLNNLFNIWRNYYIFNLTCS